MGNFLLPHSTSVVRALALAEKILGLPSVTQRALVPFRARLMVTGDTCPRGSIHMWGDFQEVCSSLEAQSVLAWASLFWGTFFQNVLSHRRPDPENFSWLVFNLQFPLLKGQSHQCGSLECSVPVGGGWAPLTCWSLLGTAILLKWHHFRVWGEKKTAQHF